MHRRPPSFAGVVFIGGQSPLLVGGCLHLCLWEFTFVCGRLPLFVGGRAVGVVMPFVCGSSSLQVVVPLVGCSVGALVGCGGGGKLVCGGVCSFFGHFSHNTMIVALLLAL